MGIRTWIASLGRATPPDDPAGTQPNERYGATGTINYNGWLLSSDYNRDLSDRLRVVQVWERMRRSDPVVRETLMHLKAPILNANWTIEPPEDPSDDEREQAEFVRAAIFDWMVQPWQEALTHLLTYLEFGHAVAETEFQVVERELVIDTPPQPADVSPTPEKQAPGTLPPIPQAPAGEQRRIPSRQFQTWRKLGPRLPATLWLWNTDEFGDLVSIKQNVPVTMPDGTQNWLQPVTPAENLVVLTHEKWGDEFTGTSLLRAAYKPWVFKEMLEKIAGMAYERFGVGIPVAYIPRDHAQDEEIAESVETALKNLGSGDQTYIVFPGPKQTGGLHGTPGYLLEIVGPTGGIPDFDAILRYFRAEVKGAMLARFSEMGAQSGGNRATTDSLMEVYYNALHAIAKYICETMQASINRLVDMNYSGVQRYPRLAASGIEARNLLEFAQALALLAADGFITPDERTRAWVRGEADAPPEDEASVRAQQAYSAELERAKGAVPAPEPPAPGGPGRTTETANPKETARPRAQNADEFAAVAAAMTNAISDVFKTVAASQDFGARTTAKLEKAIEQLGADFKANPPTVTFADGAFHIEVAAPTIEGTKIELVVEASEQGPRTKRLYRNAAGDITRIEEV